jgi:hypothetical protein
VLLWLLATFVYLSLGFVAGQPITTALLAIGGATILSGARAAADERTYRQRQPRMWRALKRTGTAVGRLIRFSIVFRDIPAANPREMSITIRELALRRGQNPSWTSYETTMIRRGLEGALLAFEAEVGRQVPNLPAAASRRIDEIAEGVDDSAEKMLEVAMAADRLFPPVGDATEHERHRRKWSETIEAALVPLGLLIASASGSFTPPMPDARDALDHGTAKLARCSSVLATTRHFAILEAMRL